MTRNLAAHASWYIESHLDEPLDLERISGALGVSPHHLAHAFTAATGTPVMAHVRARRLTRAAKALAGGAGDILAEALAAGYGSHEAFSRAFHNHFGCSPSVVRERARVDDMPLTEPLSLPASGRDTVMPPDIRPFGPSTLIGLSHRYDCDSRPAIPAQWARFAPHIGHIPGQVGADAFGVCTTADDDGGFEYITAVRVDGTVDAAFSGFTRLTLDRRHYAVFTHEGPVAQLSETVLAVWNDWLPASGLTVAATPVFERYDDRFDPERGVGPVEVWVPLDRWRPANQAPPAHALALD